VHLSRDIKIRLVILAVIAFAAGAAMFLGYARVPSLLGMGRYTVTMELPRSGGLYNTGNVTYRGIEVGKVKSVHLTDRGTVQAELSLNSAVPIPSNLQAQVHSQTAIGEQYVELSPRDASSPPLKNGDVIAAKDTLLPPDVADLLDATNRGLQAIPQDNLKTVVDESYTAFGGLGPELSRIVKGATALAIDARANMDSLTTLIDKSGPILDTQTDTSDSVQAWASHLNTISDELRKNDSAVAGVIDNGGPAAAEARQLFERLQPTLPVVLANLVTVGKVGITYHDNIEQLLVLIPQAVGMGQGMSVANMNSKQFFGAPYLDFNLNLNLPPPCTTGFLPASQKRTAVQVDAPNPPPGDLYCRIPQDAPFNVRGARNVPCETVPGKRAPTVKMCESDAQYVPLNDGFNWKGDPNATLTGQGVPQLPGDYGPQAPPAGAPPAGPAPPEAGAPGPPTAPRIAVAEYDPATGSYVGPDGKLYTQSDLAQNAPEEKTWQSMLTPPHQN
jgi:phospholipid/cholesterol/gamma-HCH transport system substrate-binding protein